MHALLTSKKLFGVVAVALLVGATVFLFFRSSALATSEPIGVRWLLPHGPKELFNAATTTFDTLVTAASGGNMYLKQSLLPADLGMAASGEHEFMRFADTDPAGMVSEYVGHLGGMHHPEYLGLDLPFLFDDYESALKFLDSPEAKQFLDSISEHSDYKALAFSMSGGFRIFISKGTEIRTVDDLKGLRVYTGFGGSPIMDTLAAFGAIATSDGKVEFDPSRELMQNHDVFETTYSRTKYFFDSNPEFVHYVTETNHSLSLTIMLVSKKFYNSLSERDRMALETAAHEAAVVEKKEAIAQEDVVRATIREMGAKIIVLTPEERETFKRASVPVWDAFKGQHGELIKLVERAGAR